MLKITRQLGCVFQDMEPPKFSSILRESSDIRKPIRCVRYQNPSLGMICPGDPHQRNPNHPKFETTNSCFLSVIMSCQKDKAAFFSLSENWGLHSPSILKPEERELVVDSRASMHMISKKDLHSAEIGNFDDVEKSYDGHNSQW